jgi:hypothetical protein
MWGHWTLVLCKTIEFCPIVAQFLCPNHTPHKPTPTQKVNHHQLAILQRNHIFQSNCSYLLHVNKIKWTIWLPCQNWNK